MQNNYISILVGGSCKFNCSFCIGKDIRKNITPHFSTKYKAFLECYGDTTHKISISGDTSDPCFLYIDEHKKIVQESKKYNLETNIHTRDIRSEKIIEISKLYDGIAFSIDETFLEQETIDFRSLNMKTRFSIVITEENYKIFNRPWLDEVYERTGVASMTFRPDVFSNKDYFKNFLDAMEFNKFVLDKNGVQWMPYKDKFITFWDNKNIEQEVKYLWSNSEITDNCKWSKLYA